MSEYPGGRGDSPAGIQPRLGIVALVAVVVGVLVLAAAAFLLSYSGLHRIALQAGVSHGLATLYPVIFDAMLVTAGAAALAMRGAGWWAKFYVWLCLLLLLAVVGTGSAVHAMGVTLPRQATRAGVAVAPWALLLLGFGVWLVLLRQLRQSRRALRRQRHRAVARPTARNGSPRPDLSPRTDLDSLLTHREGPAPAIAAAAASAAASAAARDTQATAAPASQAPVPTVPAQSPAPPEEGPAEAPISTAAEATSGTMAEVSAASSEAAAEVTDIAEPARGYPPALGTTDHTREVAHGGRQPEGYPAAVELPIAYPPARPYHGGTEHAVDYLAPAAGTAAAEEHDPATDITYGHSGYVHPASYQEYGEYLGYADSEPGYSGGDSFAAEQETGDTAASDENPESDESPEMDAGPGLTGPAATDTDQEDLAEGGHDGPTAAEPAEARAAARTAEATETDEAMQTAEATRGETQGAASAGGIPSAEGAESAEPSFERVRSTPTPPERDSVS